MNRENTLSIGLVALALMASLAGCSSLAPSFLASTNTELIPQSEAINSKASFNIKRNRGKDPRTLLVLALSGGGSRAAYWSASAMLKMQPYLLVKT